MKLDTKLFLGFQVSAKPQRRINGKKISVQQKNPA